MIKKDFGSIIANKRKDRKLSQPQLAALLCERGLDVKAHSISKWEKNVNLPNILHCTSIASLSHISKVPGHEAAHGGRRRGTDRHYPRAAAVRSVRLIGSSFASRKSTEGAAFGRHPPERRATLWISYGIRSRNG